MIVRVFALTFVSFGWGGGFNYSILFEISGNIKYFCLLSALYDHIELSLHSSGVASL